jgi:hypothetical protein
MLEVKSEKMVKCFFPKSFLDDLGGVTPFGSANPRPAYRPPGAYLVFLVRYY